MLLRNLSEVYKKGLHPMSDLYKRIEDLCKERKITITSMCKESGASRASLSDLKVGRKQGLSADTLNKIAKFFSVSVDYLLGNVSDPFFVLDNDAILADINSYEDKEKAPTLTKKDERDIAKSLEAIMADLEHSGDLMFDGDPMTEEARQSMRNAIELGLKAVKLLNKETYNPNKNKKG